MNSFYQLFLANFRMFYREKGGFYWTILMPSFIYIALSVLPLSKSIGNGFSYSSYVLPGIIAMTIMQGGIYGLAYWMVDLKSRGVIKKLLATPLKQWHLLLSLISARLIVVVAQVIILTILGILIFHANFAGNVFSTLILVLLGGAIFLLFGLLIATYAKSYDTAAPITSAIGLPMTFLGNIFYPIDSLPHGLQTIAKLLPITYLADGLRQSYLFPFNFAKIGFDILILAIWLITLLAATILVFRLKE